MEIKPFVDSVGLRCFRTEACGTHVLPAVPDSWKCPDCGFQASLGPLAAAARQITLGIHTAADVGIDARDMGLEDFEGAKNHHVLAAMRGPISAWEMPDTRITRLTCRWEECDTFLQWQEPLTAVVPGRHLFSDPFTHPLRPLLDEESPPLVHLAPLCAALHTWNTAVEWGKANGILAWPVLGDPVLTALWRSKSGREPHA